MQWCGRVVSKVRGMLFGQLIGSVFSWVKEIYNGIRRHFLRRDRENEGPRCRSMISWAPVHRPISFFSSRIPSTSSVSTKERVKSKIFGYWKTHTRSKDQFRFVPFPNIRFDLIRFFHGRYARSPDECFLVFFVETKPTTRKSYGKSSWRSHPVSCFLVSFQFSAIPGLDWYTLRRIWDVEDEKGNAVSHIIIWRSL